MMELERKNRKDTKNKWTKKRRHNYVGLANLSQHSKLATRTVRLGYLHKKQIEKKNKRAQSLIKLILLNDEIKKEN